MKKTIAILTFVLILIQNSNLKAAASSMPVEEFETRWGLGVAVNRGTSQLHIHVETLKTLETSRGELSNGLPEWRVSIGFGPRERETKEVKRHLTSFICSIKSSVFEEESRLFLERTGESLFNVDEEECSVRRLLARDTLAKDIGDFCLFSSVLEKPILHIAEVYERLKFILVRLEIGKIPLPLMFKEDGISKNPNEYVRNWNSFAVLASVRCFGIPLSVDPKLEQYVDDVRLRERWTDSEWPTHDKVIERMLISYAEIQKRAPRFRMNRNFVRYLGCSLDGLFLDSGITKQLKRIEEEKSSSGRTGK